jgi:hypothetical protein
LWFLLPQYIFGFPLSLDEGSCLELDTFSFFVFD